MNASPRATAPQPPETQHDRHHYQGAGDSRMRQLANIEGDEIVIRVPISATRLQQKEN
jgi:hypothetical protein